MLTSGFAHAPVSRTLVISTIISSLLASLTDCKTFLNLEIRPHVLDYGQYWRFLTWQLCYSNSTEVLLAAWAFYHLRVIERLWGSRKFASFILTTFPYTTLLPPLLLAAVIRPLSGGWINAIPSGPTPLIFALLVQYHAAVPYVYKYRLSGSLPAPSDPASSQTREYGLTLTSKCTSYILPLQLALTQLPGSALTAAVGWIIGLSYRRDLLPGAATWRLPSWAVGGGAQRRRYDSLRRRMEGEAGRTTGVEAGTTNAEATRRRGVVGDLLNQFRGGD
ncbi:hypothetical protein K470DRAFT_246881 [Piedraia hortae CBS 480.64]|uniref:Peptidase S54 rhomboid domain-containing protein n=1 Tax=Piedraia hortae CBS 480.64 TaxID=1314780 RepID=A0A6A7BZK3_9PEZI|nr:hypothetical protein K470DRAFT_246881 [Piedraia hortae CBS 480.64]